MRIKGFSKYYRLCRRCGEYKQVLGKRSKVCIDCNKLCGVKENGK